jgi:hypothetical protein
MTLANRRDFLDALLVDIGERKQQGVVRLLTERVTYVGDLLKKYRQEQADNIKKAALDQVTDVNAAVEAFKKEFTQPAHLTLNENTPTELLEVREFAALLVAGINVLQSSSTCRS